MEADLMEFFIFVGAVLLAIAIAAWRDRHSITCATESAMIAELKRRAFERKLKDEANSEVEARLRGSK